MAEPLVRGRSPPETEAFLAFRRSMEGANLPTFRNFGNTKTSDMLSLQKIMGGHETGAGAG